MVGEAWTNKSAIVRLSFVSPVVVLLALRALSDLLGTRPAPSIIFGLLLLTIVWVGFVVWRTTMNAHKRNAYFGDTQS